MKLVLIRHGESQWNLENKFTGWKDVDLSPKGVEEAKAGGKALKEMALRPASKALEWTSERILNWL